MKTQNKNAVIAKFMTFEPEVLEMDLKRAGTLESMQYHCDWGWIMEVVERIEDLGYPIDIFKKAVSIHLDNGEPIVDLCGVNYKTKIGAVHEAVYQFVVWHNAQVKENPKP